MSLRTISIFFSLVLSGCSQLPVGISFLDRSVATEKYPSQNLLNNLKMAGIRYVLKKEKIFGKKQKCAIMLL